MILVTGGAGFIGSNFILDWIKGEGTPVVNLDKLTYAGNLGNLESLAGDTRHIFVRGDIADGKLVKRLLREHRPRAVVHFAAASHVDRSIHDPAEFIQTNVLGTFCLLEQARAYWETLPAKEKSGFRFIHVSSDEVYGSLGAKDAAFTEMSAYRPNSPYSASKAASDHLARSYHKTYGFPAIITNSSNNYGPFQFPEKLVPLMVLNACRREALPLYGKGENVRDWIYVGDHCAALRLVLARGQPGECYNIGGGTELTNLEVVHALCAVMDEAVSGNAPHERLINFVQDRPGHDFRYAINSEKIRTQLGWRPRMDFSQGLRATVSWYLENPGWLQSVTSGDYRNWIEKNYRGRRVQ